MTALIPMAQINITAEQGHSDEAELAAGAFLARYQGRTLEADRYDLRALFHWAGGEGLVILSCWRPDSRSSSTPCHGGSRPGGDHHRPVAVHRLRLLPLRAHRRSNRL